MIEAAQAEYHDQRTLVEVEEWSGGEHEKKEDEKNKKHTKSNNLLRNRCRPHWNMKREKSMARLPKLKSVDTTSCIRMRRSRDFFI